MDESREYGTWADWLGVPRHTFSAVFGSVIAKGLQQDDPDAGRVPTMRIDSLAELAGRIAAFNAAGC